MTTCELVITKAVFFIGFGDRWPRAHRVQEMGAMSELYGGGGVGVWGGGVIH